MKTYLTVKESENLIRHGVDPKLASGSICTDDEGWGIYQQLPTFYLTDMIEILPKEIVVKINDLTINSNIMIIEWLGEKREWFVRYEYNEYFNAPELIDALQLLLLWCIKNDYYKPTNKEENGN